MKTNPGQRRSEPAAKYNVRVLAGEQLVRTDPAAAPANNPHNEKSPEPAAADPQRNQLRHNPRLVIGGLDYFDLLMEQDEQQ